MGICKILILILIARDVELEQVRRATPKQCNAENSTKNTISKVNTGKINAPKSTINENKLPNHLRKLQPKIITQPTKKIVKDIVSIFSSLILLNNLQSSINPFIII